MTFAPGHRVKKPTRCVHSIEHRALRKIQILVSSAFGRLRRLRRAPALCAELIALERMTLHDLASRDECLRLKPANGDSSGAPNGTIAMQRRCQLTFFTCLSV
jgi:hypothetical protein